MEKIFLLLLFYSDIFFFKFSDDLFEEDKKPDSDVISNSIRQKIAKKWGMSFVLSIVLSCVLGFFMTGISSNLSFLNLIVIFVIFCFYERRIQNYYQVE